MKKDFSKKQLKDIECIKFFIPNQWKNVEITQEDIKDFLDYSDIGIKRRGNPDERHVEITGKRRSVTGYDVLIEGKRWRGITIHELWEPGILDGSVPYYVLLGGEDNDEILPRFVIDFIKRELFKGLDAELIEEIYNKIIKEYENNKKIWKRLITICKNIIGAIITATSFVVCLFMRRYTRKGRGWVVDPLLRHSGLESQSAHIKGS